jgi:hypothetical protein
MRALKALVVVMGIMIVAGVAVLAATIVGRLSPSGNVAPQTFAAAPIDIPRGARIETMSTESGRLVLDLVLADGTRQLVIIDLASGKKLGTIPLRPAP